jgi:putative transposase
MRRKYRTQDPKSSRFVNRDEDCLQMQFNRVQLMQLMQDGMHSLALELGRIVAVGILEDEVTQLCGKPHRRNPERQQVRHGYDPGWITLGSQKVPIERPRVRSVKDRGEVHLHNYPQLQQSQRMAEDVLRRMVRGVSCRDYEQVVDTARAGFGIKRSSVSRAFKRSQTVKVRQFCQRRWDNVRFAVIYVDGKAYAGQQMIAALGITFDGRKSILGLRQGTTENAEVCKDLLTDLTARGVAPDKMTLFVLDGAKALAAAVKRVWGEYAEVQRCQLHKQRNIQSYLAKEYWGELSARLNRAWQETDYDAALRQLEQTAQWLEGINPDAASSLREGMAETLTVVRLGVPKLLRQTLSSTNAIDSALSIAERVTGRVTRWRRGDMRWRWCAAGLQLAEGKFHRVSGYKQIPQLIAALDRIAVEKGLDRKTEVA